ncbi:hypothetical protein [Pseudomonas sp. SMV7]|uniref:hypothetical protein n=1 Tax=Pseudomonas sp. SMV7 TaxID=3390194 RepID=UPI003F841169
MSDTKLLTLRDVPVELVHTARRLTGKGTGSQAFIACVSLAEHQADQIADMREQIQSLREQVKVYQGVLRDAHQAAVQLAEVAGQGDMFTPSSENPLRPGYRR